MKKAAVALALAALLSGCAAPAAPTMSPSSAELTVWMFPVIADPARSKEFWAAAEKDFEAAHPRIDLTIELRPAADAGEKLEKAIADGTGPDLALLQSPELPRYVSKRLLTPMIAGLDPAFTAGGLRDCSVAGDVYAIPLYQEVFTTAYNKAAFKAAGVRRLPTSWREVAQISDKMAAKGVAVLDFSLDAPLTRTFYPLLWQAEGQVYADDLKTVAFNNGAGLASLEFLLALRNANGLSMSPAPGAGGTSKALTSGKAAMSLSASMADVEAMTSALGDSSIAVGAPLMGQRSVTYGTSGVLARTVLGTDDVAVASAAKFLGSADFEQKLADAAGVLPARVDIENTGSAARKTFLEARGPVQVPADSPKSDKVEAVLRKQIAAVLAGEKSPSAALDAAAVQANKVLADS